MTVNASEVTDGSTLYTPDWAAGSFANLLDPIAVRIVLIAKLRLGTMRANAIGLRRKLSCFSEIVFRMRRLGNFPNHITVVVVGGRFPVEVVWSHVP